MNQTLLILLLGAALGAGDETGGKEFPVYNSFVTSLQPKEFQVNGTRTKWKLRPTVTIPALKIESSRDTQSLVDANVLSAIGGGVSLSLIKLDTAGPGKSFESLISLSPLTILLSSRYDGREKSVLDVSWAGTVGIFDDKFMLGVGCNFGRNWKPHAWERFFLLLGIGVNFN